MTVVVAIDGPSGAGKGTICRLVAKSTGFHLLDSGALYRITGVAGLRNKLDLDDAPRIGKFAANLTIEFKTKDDHTLVFVNGDDYTTAIRTEEAGMAASKVAKHPEVRSALLQQQRDFAKAPGLVADGRDMGTVVFPDAEVKIFLTASAEERARRRVNQLEESGQTANYDDVLRDIKRRDDQDSNRASAPLKPASDAIILDSTELSIEEVLQCVLEKIPE